jgi:hypothetical protein
MVLFSRIRTYVRKRIEQVAGGEGCGGEEVDVVVVALAMVVVVVARIVREQRGIHW